ncbi:hypothetical protein LLF88_02485 [bacterium]|nr:hypothetical protein [bacterium]
MNLEERLKEDPVLKKQFDVPDSFRSEDNFAVRNLPELVTGMTEVMGMEVLWTSNPCPRGKWKPPDKCSVGSGVKDTGVQGCSMQD